MEEDRFCIVLIGIKNEEITRRQMSYRPDMVKYHGDIFIRQWSNGPNERGEEEFYYKRVSLISWEDDVVQDNGVQLSRLSRLEERIILLENSLDHILDKIYELEKACCKSISRINDVSTN